MPPKANRHRQTTPAVILGASLIALDQLFKIRSPIVWLHDRSTPWLPVVMGFLLLLILVSKRYLRLQTPIPFFLILAGSLSNIIDILIRGSVINYWPWRENTNRIFYTTNIADLTIWVGLIWLIIEILTRTIWQRRRLR